MTRFGAWIGRSVVAAAAAWGLVSGSPSSADIDVWKTAASGVWGTGGSWVDGTTPSSIFDQANINLAGTYTVSFSADPDPIGALTVNSAANVTFASNSRPPSPIVPRTLRLVDTSGGGDLSVRGRATLTLGHMTGGFPSSHPFHLTAGGELTVEFFSTLNVLFGSDVVTSILRNRGTTNVSGSGSTLNAGSTNITGDSVINVSGSGSTFNAGSMIFEIGGGDLTVTAGGRVESSASVMRQGGAIHVSGSGSTLIGGSMLIDGGNLKVTAGGRVESSAVDLGFSEGSGGGAFVSGVGSTWAIIDQELVVSGSGTGELNIMAGGAVSSRGGVIGGFDHGVGVVNVSDAGSQWNNSGNLFVGDRASGLLTVTGGGSVSSTDGYIGQGLGSVGTALITGGAWTMTGQLSVGGSGSTAGGQGTLNIQPAGTVSAAQGVVLFPDAHVNLQGGTLDASAISYHQGIQGSQFQWTSGTLHVGTFNGNLVNSSGTLAPGHSAGNTTINGNYTQQSGGALEIEIGGPLA
ncbi:MAG: hypothetical protein H0T51_02150, partial [Pirellulales bacterium]|nr:hypothetical protein [Pirellulales bacterium]